MTTLVLAMDTVEYVTDVLAVVTLTAFSPWKRRRATMLGLLVRAEASGPEAGTGPSAPLLDRFGDALGAGPVWNAPMGAPDGAKR